MLDGNRLVLLSARSGAVSHEASTAAARSEMASKIEKVMKPYYRTGKDR